MSKLLLFSLLVVSDSVIPWTAARQASLSFTISLSLLKLMSIESVMPSNHLVLCHPLLLPSIFPSIRVFYNELSWNKRRGYSPESISITYKIFSVGLNRIHQLPAIVPDGSDGKASAYNAGDPGSIPGLGRSPGEGNGNPLRYSCLENPMDGAL